MILSRQKLKEITKENPNTFNVICITESDMPMIQEVAENAKNYIWLQFDDITYERGSYKVPDKAQIEEAIKWGKNKDNLIVACHAGISRSSAIAYLIECAKTKNPKEALKVLTPFRHFPNSLIVRIGAELLADNNILKEYQAWLQ